MIDKPLNVVRESLQAYADRGVFGEFVNFDPIWSFPKPVRKPHPPIVMGGNGPTAFDRVVEFRDGWMPIAMRSGNLAERIPALKKKAEAAWRDPDSISISIFAAKPDSAFIEKLERAGVHRAIFLLPPADRETAYRFSTATPN